MPHLEITTELSLTRPFVLLERDEPLAALSGALELVRQGGMRVAISGEAGIGKSSLLEAFARHEVPNAEFFWGRCDALNTPSPLGPLLDIASDLSGQLRECLRT